MEESDAAFEIVLNRLIDHAIGGAHDWRQAEAP
jgi:hypothetical protein